jgi:ABC-type multidrug transport system fused ATPase/permease subunit
MMDWVYSTPVWEWGTVIVVGATLVSCFGLVLFQKIVPASARQAENDVVSGTMAIVGVAYAVLIAFIAVATWQAFTDGDKATDIEASHIANLYRDVEGLPPNIADPIREHVKGYVDKVVNVEWPTQQKGELSRAGRADIEAVHSLIVSFVPANGREQVIQGEFLRVLNELYSARRTRQLAAQNSIPDVIWGIIVLGSIGTIAYSYLFCVADRRLHLVMTGMVGASMALVIVLVLALDQPFRGDLSISTDAYTNAFASISGMGSDTDIESKSRR